MMIFVPGYSSNTPDVISRNECVSVSMPQPSGGPCIGEAWSLK